LEFSYGFRQGRSQHQALDALTVGIRSPGVNWIVDADIAAFFDEIDHVIEDGRRVHSHPFKQKHP